MNSSLPDLDTLPWPATAPRIVAVAPQIPVAEMAAKVIFERYRGGGETPEALTHLLVLVPTRRAARALRDALLRQSAGEPLLLPRIQPIGEAAEDEMVFAQLLADPVSTEALFSLPPAMEPAERALRMTQLLKRLDRALPLEQLAKLALSLLAVLDDCQRYGCAPEKLREIVPEALAMHWQKVLLVLNVIWQYWPDVVEESGSMDPIRRRDATLELLIAHWGRMPPEHPVLSVGTFGTQTASRRLLGAVAAMPEGLVLLSDVETGMPDEVWAAVDGSHQAHALKQLLESMHETRACLTRWTAPDNERARLWQEALLPAENTDRWREPAMDGEAFVRALGGMHRILAPHTALEAQTIALLLREALETPGKTAALVTPDRQLAAQVQAHLASLGVDIEDSAGMPVLRTPAGRFIQLVMDAASAGFAPVPLLALLHHPLAQNGMERGAWLRVVRDFEMHCLRGLRPEAGLAGLRLRLSTCEAAAWEAMQTWLDDLCRLFEPLDALFRQFEPETLEACMQCHLTVATALSTTPDGVARLWEQPESAALTRVLESLRRHSAHLAPLPPQHYPPLLVVLMAGDAWQPRYGAHPRLQILSPQEARLQRFDRLILGGLNEGVWPVREETGPWLSRPMREEAGMGLTEESLGLQALDFFQLVMAPELYLTHSAKKSGSGALPSRYLQRLEAVLQSYRLRAQGAPGTDIPSIDAPEMLHLAEALLHHAGPVRPEARPEPKPPVSARPRRLAVTHIDTLATDPYSLYAKKILRLDALKEIDAEPEAAELGNLMHTLLERLSRAFPDVWDDHIPARFDALAAEELAAWHAYPLLQSMAREQIARLREWLMPLEEARRAGIGGVRPEQKITHHWQSPGGPFELSARIDRVETPKNDGQGTATRLIDYKSGAIPSVSEMQKGVRNQLPLQGWMAGMHAASPVGLEFWQLRADDAEEAVRTLEQMCAAKRSDKTTPEALIDAAGHRVMALIAAFDRLETGYGAAFQPPNLGYEPTYAHLARQGEWE